MVYRIFVEKKEGLENEARDILADIKGNLQIQSVQNVRLINRYDAEGMDKELFDYCVGTVFSEPQLDTASEEITADDAQVFAVEYLPGQFDQRADSAAQCIQIISQQEKPIVKTAKVYMIYGDVSADEMEQIKKYVINAVEAREASLDKPETLKMSYEVPSEVEILDGFIDLDQAGLVDFVKSYALAMDNDDIKFCQDYFISENRNPTITEIRMIDTYWSDHCRHTTFGTIIDNAKFEDKLIQEAYEDYLATRKDLGREHKPLCLMDLATVGGRYLKKAGFLEKLDESEEINACTVKIDVEVDGVSEPWLLLFKNETHNHPTEIEPFGGAATCIGGAIRDPLSGRAYVYGAMRVTGAANPLKSVSETIKGKLSQRKIVTTAAAGYSSYGNQIGLATGIVDEIYHDGYAAKRMEIGAVVAATPATDVRRECPDDGDIVVLIGGATGRDGCGGATGSSKSHTIESLDSCGAEVQKGNAPEERKLQRLFRNKKACAMIKRCNDFGAGGVSVAIGELADGLVIDLNAVPKKYEGLDGTEIAISESQERMAVVIEKENVDAFLALAYEENLNACVVARVQDEKRLVMHWNGKNICDISRDFLNSNGAEKHIDVDVSKAMSYENEIPTAFADGLSNLAGDLNICSKRGLSERFDSSIGAGTVLMPFGGKNQLTPIQAMVQKISTEKKRTDDCSVMSWGYNPFLTEKSPYHGAYMAVVESVAKLIATGAKNEDVYLTFQEYFERLNKDSKRWGKPLAALLGAYKAQKDLKIAAIGGKDSMSGTFEELEVPPTLVSFAVTTDKVKNIVSNEFKKAGNKLIKITPKYDENGLPNTESLLEVFDKVTALLRFDKGHSCYTLGLGGIAEAVMKMSFGNGLGFAFDDGVSLQDMFKLGYGSFLVEVDHDLEIDEKVIGYVTDEKAYTYKGEKVEVSSVLNTYENKLESVFTCNIPTKKLEVSNFSFNATERKAPAIKVAKPKVLIPVFPGTNCEYDSAKAMDYAGAESEIIVLNNLSADGIARSIETFAKKLETAQMVFIPGGFSGGDEPDGSGKFITAFFRNAAIKEQVTSLLEDRDGLMCGICNGFQALIKLGLVPYGKIMDTDESCPTLTFNTIARHQSKIVRTRVASNMSPWLAQTNVGDVYNVPISHGEGRFLASEETIAELAKNGQIATQYVDLNDQATYDVAFNPNDSMHAIEGITSPDGRVFGKMGHSERIGDGLYKNVYGDYDIKMFKSAVEYFK
ncbi:MAG: phosphoribosylformylglycinamidine synthase [Clostridia bacterium]